MKFLEAVIVASGVGLIDHVIAAGQPGLFNWDARWNPQSAQNMCYAMYCLGHPDVLTDGRADTAGYEQRRMDSGQSKTPVTNSRAYGLNFDHNETFTLWDRNLGHLVTDNQRLVVADEWPPASAVEGGHTASLRATSQRDSDIQGSRMLQMWRAAIGGQVRVTVVNDYYVEGTQKVDAFYCRCKGLKGDELKRCCRNDGKQFQYDKDRDRYFFPSADGFLGYPGNVGGVGFGSGFSGFWKKPNTTANSIFPSASAHGRVGESTGIPTNSRLVKKTETLPETDGSDDANGGGEQPHDASYPILEVLETRSDQLDGSPDGTNANGNDHPGDEPHDAGFPILEVLDTRSDAHSKVSRDAPGNADEETYEEPHDAGYPILEVLNRRSDYTDGLDEEAMLKRTDKTEERGETDVPGTPGRSSPDSAGVSSPESTLSAQDTSSSDDTGASAAVDSAAPNDRRFAKTFVV